MIRLVELSGRFKVAAFMELTSLMVTYDSDWFRFSVVDRRFNASDAPQKIVVTTRSHPTQLVNDALNILKSRGLADDIERVGGAGFKVLRCLEGAAAYVFASPGCKKWDTAAPEAVLNAAGIESAIFIL